MPANCLNRCISRNRAVFRHEAHNITKAISRLNRFYQRHPSGNGLPLNVNVIAVIGVTWSERFLGAELEA